MTVQTVRTSDDQEFELDKDRMTLISARGIFGHWRQTDFFYTTTRNQLKRGLKTGRTEYETGSRSSPRLRGSSDAHTGYSPAGHYYGTSLPTLHVGCQHFKGEDAVKLYNWAMSAPTFWSKVVDAIDGQLKSIAGVVGY